MMFARLVLNQTPYDLASFLHFQILTFLRLSPSTSVQQNLPIRWKQIYFVGLAHGLTVTSQLMEENQTVTMSLRVKGSF